MISVVYTASIVMYAIVAAVLLGSPKGQKPPPAPEVSTPLVRSAVGGVTMHSVEAGCCQRVPNATCTCAAFCATHGPT